MIEYLFTMEDGRAFQFEIDPDALRGGRGDQGDHPAWTSLGFHRCRVCELDPRRNSHCPPAVDIEGIAAEFSPMVSYERTRVVVRTPQREYAKECDVQTGLSSLFGLVMATSACPILSQLRGLAHFHLPFASDEETTFRTVGAYFLKRYFRRKKGESFDYALEELEDTYDRLQLLNMEFTGRMRAASKLDANTNAIIRLFLLSESVSTSLEEKVEELRRFLYPSS